MDKFLKESCLLTKYISETSKNETNEQKMDSLACY